MQTKKLVLRPETVKTVEFDFKHFGSIDGYISNSKGKRLYGYEISVIDENGKEVTSSYADLEGYFIVPNVPFGKYDVIISKESKKLPATMLRATAHKFFYLSSFSSFFALACDIFS